MRSHDLRQLKACAHFVRNNLYFIFDHKSVAIRKQTCCKLIIKTCYLQAYCRLFQQIVTIMSVNDKLEQDADFNRLAATG